jgi:hypothetical protein
MLNLHGSKDVLLTELLVLDPGSSDAGVVIESLKDMNLQIFTKSQPN